MDQVLFYEWINRSCGVIPWSRWEYSICREKMAHLGSLCGIRTASWQLGAGKGEDWEGRQIEETWHHYSSLSIFPPYNGATNISLNHDLQTYLCFSSDHALRVAIQPYYGDWQALRKSGYWKFPRFQDSTPLGPMRLIAFFLSNWHDMDIYWQEPMTYMIINWLTAVHHRRNRSGSLVFGRMEVRYTYDQAHIVAT